MLKGNLTHVRHDSIVNGNGNDVFFGGGGSGHGGAGGGANERQVRVILATYIVLKEDGFESVITVCESRMLHDVCAEVQTHLLCSGVLKTNVKVTWALSLDFSAIAACVGGNGMHR